MQVKIYQNQKGEIRMKKDYSTPKLQLFSIDPLDVLTLSDGGQGTNGMTGSWDTEIYL